jgi:PadR family transcriptional regulator PadR
MSPPIDSTSLYGTLNLLVLQAVSSGPLHGLAIARAIQARSKDVLKIEEGALYPALHRLERDGLLASEWGTSENNRRAKFYRITVKGRKRLDREVEEWVRHTGAVRHLLGVD